MARVRTHTRRGKDGKAVRVTQHSRKGRPRKGLVSAGHAWSLMKRSYRAGRRKKKALAVTLVALGVLEFATWGFLDTAGKLLTVFAFGAFAAAGLALSATGRER